MVPARLISLATCHKGTIQVGNTRIRAGFRVAAGIAALALPLAVAGNALASAPGDNGDVKIHNIATGTDEEANNPHVCKFYLDAFNFDGLQKVHWEIDVWAGTDGDAAKGALAKEGDITLKADGSGQTSPVTLPDGHYKLFWTFDGENGAAKHKVFWVDCADDGDTGGLIGGTVGGTVGGTIGGDSSGGSTGGSTSATPTSAAPATASTSSAPKAASTTSPGAPATSPDMSPTSSLAHTGADGSALIFAGIGAAVLAGGGYGLRRYASTRSKA